MAMQPWPLQRFCFKVWRSGETFASAASVQYLSTLCMIAEGNQQEVLHFETRSGRLSVRRDQAAQKELHLQMDFPAFPATAALPPVVSKVKDKLKVCPSSVAKQQLADKYF